MRFNDVFRFNVRFNVFRFVMDLRRHVQKHKFGRFLDIRKELDRLHTLSRTKNAKVWGFQDLSAIKIANFCSQ